MKNEYLSIYLRCKTITSSHNLLLQSAQPNSVYSFYSTLSSFSFEYPVVNCIIQEHCILNAIVSLPDDCKLIAYDELPAGFVISEDGIMTAYPEQIQDKHDYLVGCENDDTYQTTLSIIVSGSFLHDRSLVDSVIAPSAITLTVGEKVIENDISLSLGVDFFIGVLIDFSLGVELVVTPPLPSSVIVTPSYIAGNITQPIEGNYTLHAINQKGCFERTIFIHTESNPDSQYYIHLLTGKGSMRASISDEILVDSTVSGGIRIPFTTVNETLHIQFMCRHAEGCWIRIESVIQQLPSRFVHYNENLATRYTFPLESLSVTPLITDVVGILDEPIPTLLWEQTGLFSEVLLVDLPSWIYFNPDENRVEGVAEEAGFFSGFVSVVSELEVIDFPVNITVYDRMSLYANETVVSVVYHNDNHSSILTYSSTIDDTLFSQEVVLNSKSTILIQSYLILTDGLYNLTFATKCV